MSNWSGLGHPNRNAPYAVGDVGHFDCAQTQVELGQVLLTYRKELVCTGCMIYLNKALLPTIWAFLPLISIGEEGSLW